MYKFRKLLSYLKKNPYSTECSIQYSILVDRQLIETFNLDTMQNKRVFHLSIFIYTASIHSYILPK